MNPKPKNVVGRRFVPWLRWGCSAARGCCMPPTTAALQGRNERHDHQRIQPSDRRRTVHPGVWQLTNVSSGKCAEPPPAAAPAPAAPQPETPAPAASTAPEPLQPQSRYRRTSFQWHRPRRSWLTTAGSASSTINPRQGPSYPCTPTPRRWYTWWRVAPRTSPSRTDERSRARDNGRGPHQRAGDALPGARLSVPRDPDRDR